MQNILFLMNGSKKINVHLQRFLDTCSKEFGNHISFIASKKEKELIELSKNHVGQADIIIAIGGDGTLNEIINGVMLSASHELPIIGIIPYGTGNDFYQSTFFSKFDFTGFLQALKHPTVILSDVGRIETEGEIRYFLNVADIGFGGAVVISLTSFRKTFGQRFSYSLAILKTFFGYKRPTVLIKAAHFEHEGELLLAAACNGSIFGNGLHIHPKASISDGQLNLTILAKVSLYDYLKNVLKVKRGKRIIHPEAHYIESNTFLLKSTSGVLHAEADGEYLSGQQFEISLLPQSLKILSF
ncbi:MAG: hypothetical protein RJB36_1524 [Bacteroidota bacterium]